MPEGQPIIAGRVSPLGGRRLVCVRTCDGSFFPLSNAPGGRESADEMCQALCPGTETLAFATPGGDNGLNRAVSVSGGKAYTSLANAFKFRKTFDGSCACKKDNESWAVILRRAESMLEQRKGDMIVTAEKAEETVAPEGRPGPQGRREEGQGRGEGRRRDRRRRADRQQGILRHRPAIHREHTVVSTRAKARRRTSSRATARSGPIRVVAPNVIPVPNAKN